MLMNRRRLAAAGISSIALVVVASVAAAVSPWYGWALGLLWAAGCAVLTGRVAWAAAPQGPRQMARDSARTAGWLVGPLFIIGAIGSVWVAVTQYGFHAWLDLALFSGAMFGIYAGVFAAGWATVLGCVLLLVRLRDRADNL